MQLCLVVVGIQSDALVVQKVGGRDWRGNGGKRQWSLVEVETICQIIGARVGVPERPEWERLFDELEDAAKVMGRMRDVSAARVWRNQDQRPSEPVDIS